MNSSSVRNRKTINAAVRLKEKQELQGEYDDSDVAK